MSKHTPGPWVYESSIYEDAHCAIAALNEANLQTVALVMKRPGAPLNACLIAAAPDLLEALRSAADSLQQLVDLGRIPANNAGLRDARAAIEKAEGRS